MQSQLPTTNTPPDGKTVSLSDAELWRVRRVFELLAKVERRRSLNQQKGERNEEVQAT